MSELQKRLRAVQSIRRDATPLSVAVALCSEAADALDARDARDAEIARLTRERDEWHGRVAEAVRLRRERDEARTERDALRARCEASEKNAERLKRGLQFYAAGDHFQNDGAFETVSGEPPNFWCDQEGSMVEDGTVAKKYLEGWDVDNDDCWIMPGFDAARGEA